MFLAAALSPAASAEDRYGYYRIVEGSATLLQLGESGQQGDAQSLQENQPLLTGDRLRTARGSRVEVVLADNSMLRVGGDTEVVFDQLASSGDGNSDLNLVSLRRGEVQLVSDGAAETRIDTDNASVYLRELGNYRVESRDETTLLVVRAGRAEARTRRGAIAVNEDEEAWIEGDDAPEVQAASALDSLEHWASNLDDQSQRARWDDDYVDPSLGYASSRMAEYGSWVTVSNRQAWRPRVAADWSPYRHGRWVYTPSGLTWSSYEPWGWVPYHYGSWDYTPGWGWAWYPGHVYAPAWVYWYWGPTYVGWAPFGYYSHYYGPRWYGGYGHGYDYTWGFGRRVHGWGGGSHWDHWNFVDCGNVYDRRLANHTRTAVQLGTQGSLPRGIITTETRGLKPDVATRPSQGMWTLANDRSGREKPVRELPDVSRFVARDPNVSAEVGRVALPVDSDGAIGGRGGNGRGAPGEKPAWAGGNNSGVGGTDAVARPRGRSGVENGVAGSDPTGGRNGKPSGADDWRGGAVGRDGGGKPAIETGDKPGDAPSASWRQRPDSGNGGNGRSASARVPGSGVTSKPGRPTVDSSGRGDEKPGSGAAGARPRGGDEGWRGGDSPQARESAPRASVRTPKPEAYDQSPRRNVERTPSSDDESWRGAGREGTSGGRPPVRRIVEGVRSNQTVDKPSSSRQVRPAEPPRVEPRSSAPRQQAPVSRPQPQPERQRQVERPQQPRNDGAAGRSGDSGPSRGSSDRGSSGDHGGGRESGGSRGASDSRPQHGDKGGGDPNR
ncbi:MAG TPA: DUF6600 domain-containing protein [Thermoanaerobaculia bacterium]|nr:DUF6600 domain-containing protein [Thermoanaerobaculia bacterium]